MSTSLDPAIHRPTDPPIWNRVKDAGLLDRPGPIPDALKNDLVDRVDELARNGLTFETIPPNGGCLAWSEPEAGPLSPAQVVEELASGEEGVHLGVQKPYQNSGLVVENYYGGNLRSLEDLREVDAFYGISAERPRLEELPDGDLAQALAGLDHAGWKLAYKPHGGSKVPPFPSDAFGVYRLRWAPGDFWVTGERGLDTFHIFGEPHQVVEFAAQNQFPDGGAWGTLDGHQSR